MIVPTTQKPANHQQALEPSTSGWTDEREGVFFRITASLFPPEFLYGASVLLASYDAE